MQYLISLLHLNVSLSTVGAFKLDREGYVVVKKMARRFIVGDDGNVFLLGEGDLLDDENYEEEFNATYGQSRRIMLVLRGYIRVMGIISKI